MVVRVSGGATSRAPIAAYRWATAHPALVAAAVLVFVAAGTYGPYIPRGGFVHDDWWISSEYSLNEPGLLNGLRTGLETSGRHPVVGLHTGLTHELFGGHQHLFLAWLAVLGVVTSLALFDVLRRLGVEDVLALVASAWLLVFPASSAGRLWVAGGGALLAVLLLLLGLSVALRQLEVPAWNGLVRHLPATGLYLASLLTYDVAPVILAGIVLVYRLRAGWRRAASRWAVDLIALAFAAWYVAGGTPKEVDSSGSGILANGGRTLEGAMQVLASLGGSVGSASDPGWVPVPAAALSFVAVTAVLVGALWASRRRSDPDLLRQSALMGLYGVLTILGGSAVLLVVNAYSPLGVGIYNRVNVLSAVGYVLVLAGASSALVLMAGGRRLGGDRALAAILCVGAIVGGLFVLRIRSHAHGYVGSARAQAAVLQRLGSVPRQPVGTVVYVSRTGDMAAPGVPIFAASWDLTGALRVLWRTSGVEAVPAGSIVQLRCSDRGVLPIGIVYTQRSLTAYRNALFVDGRSGESAVVRSAPECRSVATAFGFPVA